jgi:hypothetical protein
MYKIIGADGKEYGPVSAEQIRRWIAENRLNAQSKVLAEGSAEWKELAALPEFAEALAAQSAQPPPPIAAPRAPALPPDILTRDYDLDIGECISGGWNLLKDNLGLLVLAVLVYALIEVGVGLLGMIPFIGPLFSLGNLFVVGPLLGGVYFVFLKAIRRQPAEVGDVFAGFRTKYWQLFLGNLVPGLLAGLCVIPAAIVAVLALLPSAMRNHPPGLAQLLIIGAVFLVCCIPMVFLQINWIFTLPLIIDRQMDFWSAMRASWKMVRKHWWRVFGLTFLAGLIAALGILLCCVGALFTAPIAIGATMYGYETIFSPGRTQTA